MRKIFILLLIIVFLPVSVFADTNSDLDDLLNKIDSLENTIFLDSHPVNSIYITTATDETTISQMASKYGGTWEKYSQGRNIVGVGSNGVTSYNTVSSIGGLSNNKTSLSINNLPAHSHAYLKSSGTTTNNALTAEQMPAGVTHAFYNSSSLWSVGALWGGHGAVYNGTLYGWNGYTLADQGHYHTIALTQSSTKSVGASAAFSVQNPYIVAYIYKRIS